MPPPLRRLFSSSSSAAAAQQQPKTNPTRFTYGLSASYSAKRQRLDPERNLYTYDPYVRVSKTATELRNDASVKQDRTTRPQSGQDAFFISPIAQTDAIAFGVVDGVGGWEESGVDPADFAHGLCDYMSAAARSFPNGFNSTSGLPPPKEILQLGYDKVSDDAAIEAGGSTACIATLDARGRLDVANLGDSGFIHVGPHAVRNVSDAQTHAFNTPFQLSKLPRRMIEQMALFQGGARPFHDLPADAASSTHQLRHGDVLVFATDGVWDNLSPSDALAIITPVMTAAGAWVRSGDSSSSMQVGERLARLAKLGQTGWADHEEADLTAQLALALVREAKEASLDKRRDGPFAREVQRAYPGERWHGGKADDICVVVAVAVEESAAPKAKL